MGSFQSVENTGVSFSRIASLYINTLAFRDLTLTAGGRWSEQRFKQSTALGIPLGTRDRTWDIETRLQYVIARPLIAYLGYIYTIRTSTQGSAAFVENRIRFGLTYHYDIF
ncbi:MAG TPA: outer membrane beta-barrel protein [Candidatus Acidoferrum sp.]|nr:outer membrane beta-barrel protein [Candidatus Acidoferrum sp.]